MFAVGLFSLLGVSLNVYAFQVKDDNFGYLTWALYVGIGIQIFNLWTKVGIAQ